MWSFKQKFQKNQNSISINNDQITNPHNCVICITSNTCFDLISSLLFYWKINFVWNGTTKKIHISDSDKDDQRQKKYL